MFESDALMYVKNNIIDDKYLLLIESKNYVEENQDYVFGILELKFDEIVEENAESETDNIGENNESKTDNIEEDDRSETVEIIEEDDGS